MLVKVGDRWFSPEVGKPIMLVLSKWDKDFISRMAPEATRYATFHDDDPMTAEQCVDWMADIDADAKRKRKPLPVDLDADAKRKRKPLPVEELVGAKHDIVHKTLGIARAAKVAKRKGT